MAQSVLPGYRLPGGGTGCGQVRRASPCIPMHPHAPPCAIFVPIYLFTMLRNDEPRSCFLTPHLPPPSSLLPSPASCGAPLTALLYIEHWFEGMSGNGSVLHGLQRLAAGEGGAARVDGATKAKVRERCCPGDPYKAKHAGGCRGVHCPEGVMVVHAQLPTNARAPKGCLLHKIYLACLPG